MAAASEPLSITTEFTASQGSSDDRQVHEREANPADSRLGCDRSVSAPDGYAAVPQPRQGRRDVEGPSQAAVRRAKGCGRPGAPSVVRAEPQARRTPAVVPTPEQWAQEQLKNAPPRSRAWAREVAAIYGLDVSGER